MTKKRIVILSGALLCFAFIAFIVVNSMRSGEAIGFDTAIRNGILEWRNQKLNPILIGITYLGNSNTIIFLCILLLFFKRSRVEYGMPLAIAVTCSSTIQTLIKIAVQRPRPPVENFLIPQGGFSFPSGHSCSGLVFYGLFAYLLFHKAVDKIVYKVAGSLFIVLFAAIGMSRIYVGVYYRTDVLGG
ncbi:phosphatase PAP2 family protein, partial [Aminipila sp.]|uniref:phosphatase PAP2 family protein n=1 Tax=Aminipila sp. TaxID=2060095 RepID=UPI00289E6181